MKKLMRAAVLTAIVFAGANVQAIRTQSEPVRDQQTLSAAEPRDCYWINGVWVCDN